MCDEAREMCLYLFFTSIGHKRDESVFRIIFQLVCGGVFSVLFGYCESNDVKIIV